MRPLFALRFVVSVAPVVSLPHPLVGAVEQIEGALDGMPVAGWSGLEPGMLRQSAERLMRVEAGSRRS